VIAHGPGDDAENTRWMTKLAERATVIKAAAPFRRVEVVTLREDWPDKRVAAIEQIRAFVARAKAEGGQAIVLPFRVQGFGPYAKVLEGLTYVSDGQGLIPHTEVSAWIEKQVDELSARPFQAKR
jgi:sirohydrochlorin cobaltochelatase